MGNCCANRDESALKERMNEKGGPKDGLKKQNTQAYGSNTMKSTYKSGRLGGGDDCDRFDRAFEKNDIGEFVKLLASAQKIDPLEEPMHPWAKDPQTVGALACTQLAILASMKDQPEVKAKVRQLGGIPPIVTFLASKEDDRVQAAVVALSFLSVDNPENCSAMFRCGAIPQLVPCMTSPIEGLRYTAAAVARNIFMAEDAGRKEFVKAGGAAPYVRLLELPGGSKPEDAGLNLDPQLETICNIEDLILGADGVLVREYAQELVKAGAERRLQTLIKCNDPEVADMASAVLSRLKE